MVKLVVFLLFVGLALGTPVPKHRLPSLDGRIVGGEDADIRDYPYQISLIYYTFQLCGGSIISPNWIVTAAHCVDGLNDSIFQVRAGSSQAEEGGELIRVSKIVAHPKFGYDLDYDIALLQLSSDITNSNASAISVPDLDIEDTTVPEGATAVVTGWGVVQESGYEPDVLQVVEVPVIAQKDCIAAYTGYSVTDRMFCAGLLNVGGKDACQGDSGGPVAIDGVLRGIVSWGLGCARPEYPGVYTNVAALRKWIKEISDI